MKKLLLLMMVAACSFAAMATDYAGRLNVAVNGEGGAQTAKISVMKNGETYDLTLNNFLLVSEDTQMPIGTIELKGCTATEAYGVTTINFDGIVNIVAGDMEGVDQSSWIGPMLGDVPIKMTAELTETALNVNIDITMAMLEQVINVKFFGGASAGDVNGDGSINSTDVAKIVDIILAQ